MATCEDCIHYEVCEYRGLEKYATIQDLKSDCSHCIPTTDIAPKTEVERLEVELKAMRGAANSYKMHYENAKREVAREIFEKIENLFAVENFRLICNRQAFAELKKKYTEDQT